MADPNANLVPIQSSFSGFTDDKRPLPLIIADGNPDPDKGWPSFPLAYRDVDGVRYYAVQDWIRGVLQINDPKQASKHWFDVKRRLKKAGIESSVFLRTLKYRSQDGKNYDRDFTDDKGLYSITERLNVDSALEIRILDYAAAAGAEIDRQRIDTIEARETKAVEPPETSIDEDMLSFEAEFEALVGKYRIIYRGLGKSENWISTRVRSAMQRRKFTEAFQKALRDNPTQFQFAEITDDMRRGLWKRTTKQLRAEMNLPSRTNLRDHMTEIGLNYEALAESIAEAELKQNEQLSFAQAEAIVSANARSLRPHIERTSKRLGIDIPTNKPLLSSGKTAAP
jgi:hypothetical protein